jgi:hypothetical protein
MSVLIYLEGPSGGIGGTVVDITNAMQQPSEIDINPGIVSTGTAALGIVTTDDCRIREIIINSSTSINSVSVSYVGSQDKPYGTLKMGGTGGNEKVLQLPEGEYLTLVKGTYSNVVNSLTLGTSLNRLFLPQGTINASDINFQYNAPPGFMIIGFWGSTGDLVDRVGVVIRTIPPPAVPSA